MFNDPGAHRSHASRSLPLSVGMCAALLTGCGSGMSNAISGAIGTTTTVAAPATFTPATLTYISPGAVMAGTPGTSVTLQGDSINANATVLMDGTAHAADFVSSSQVQVPLSAAELAISERHAFSVRNPQATTSGVKTLLVSSWYNAFGDSITEGYNLDAPATGNYSALLAAALHLTETNNALGGDQACDVFPLQIYASGTGYTNQPAALQSLMIGTNDSYAKGTGAYEAVFNTCHQAALAWLGTPRSSRLMAGDSGLAATGGCTNAGSAANLGGLACTASGTVAATLTTGGNAVYIWYTISDFASPASVFQVTLDGIVEGTFNTMPLVPIATKNGGRASVALARIPATAGVHTITITTTGGIGIQGIGSNPVSGSDLPRVLVSDLPNQNVANPLTPAAAQLAYNVDITANVALLTADGIDLRLAPTRNYMLGTAAEMNDTLHPNAVGQQHLQAAFLSVLP